MAQNGFIALHRSLLDWGWHDDPVTGWLFVNLLLMANYTRTEWKGQTIERGQLITGRKALAVQTGLSEQNIRTALNRLKSTSEITISSTNKFSLITIVNYGKFQSISETSTSISTSTLTSDQPATNHIQQCNKEIKISERAKRFTPPTVEEVEDFAKEHKLSLDAERFCDFYASKGWKVGNSAMKDWKASARNWARGRDNFGNGVKHDERPFGGYGELR